MRVLVVGATGFLGRSVVRALSKVHHDVRGLARTADRAALVRADGGEPFLGNILDRPSLVRALEGCDAVIHLAQAPSSDLEAMRTVRVQGCRTLVEAMAQARVRRLLVGSGYWVYADNPGTIAESSAVAPRSISRVNFDTEEVARGEERSGRIETVVVRPGMVYGPGSWFEGMVADLRDRSYRFVEDGSNYLSPIHLYDAGSAFRAVAEQWDPGAVFLAVDDLPVMTREFARFVAGRLNLADPRGIPFEAARTSWGEDLALLNAASRRASNSKLRSLGWTPRYQTFDQGVPLVLEELVT